MWWSLPEPSSAASGLLLMATAAENGEGLSKLGFRGDLTDVSSPRMTSCSLSISSGTGVGNKETGAPCPAPALNSGRGRSWQGNHLEAAELRAAETWASPTKGKLFHCGPSIFGPARSWCHRVLLTNGFWLVPLNLRVLGLIWASQTQTGICLGKNKWCATSRVTEFDQLKNLILLEEFKNCLPDCVVIYLNEQKVVSLAEAAMLADEFVLTPRSVFAATALPRKFSPKLAWPSRGVWPSIGASEHRVFCYHHELGHIISGPTLKRKEGCVASKKVHVDDHSEPYDTMPTLSV